MHTIKKKLLVGLLFAFFATVVQIFIKYKSDFFAGIMNHVESITINFVVFFLIGYVLLGNVLVLKKEG